MVAPDHFGNISIEIASGQMKLVSWLYIDPFQIVLIVFSCSSQPFALYLFRTESSEHTLNIPNSSRNGVLVIENNARTIETSPSFIHFRLVRHPAHSAC